MAKETLKHGGDPMGAAIYDYHKKGTAGGRLVVHSSMFEDDEIPVEGLFRPFDQMPALEQAALRMASCCLYLQRTQSCKSRFGRS